MKKHNTLPPNFKLCTDPNVFFRLRTERMTKRTKKNLDPCIGMKYLIEGRYGGYYERTLIDLEKLKEDTKYIKSGQMYYDSEY